MHINATPIRIVVTGGDQHGTHETEYFCFTALDLDQIEEDTPITPNEVREMGVNRQFPEVFKNQEARDGKLQALVNFMGSKIDVRPEVTITIP